MAQKPSLRQKLEQLDEFMQDLSKDVGVCLFVWENVKIDPHTFSFHTNIHKNALIETGLKQLMGSLQESGQATLH